MPEGGPADGRSTDPSLCTALIQVRAMLTTSLSPPNATFSSAWKQALVRNSEQSSMYLAFRPCMMPKRRQGTHRDPSLAETSAEDRGPMSHPTSGLASFTVESQTSWSTCVVFGERRPLRACWAPYAIRMRVDGSQVGGLSWLGQMPERDPFPIRGKPAMRS